MSKLRHIAVIVEDPEASAKFFEEAFDMKRAGTARRGIYMSDGIFNVALLKKEGDEKLGLYHFSMWVDDLDAAEKKVVNGRRRISRRTPDLAELVLRGEVQEPHGPGVRPHPHRLGRRREGRRAGEISVWQSPILSSWSAQAWWACASRSRWRSRISRSFSSSR